MFQFCLSVLCLAGFLSAAEFPQAEISNGDIRLKIYLPDPKASFYRATRFDWSGMIGSLLYKGHEFYGPWFQRVDPGVRDFSYDGADIVASPCTAAVGPAEEFVTDTNQALGYQEARPGGTFVKIGVGVLRKPDDSAYNRFRLYEIADPGKWSVRTAADSIEFTQELSDASSGYSYVYSKTVQLTKDKAQMQIEHSLRNTGRRPIDTNVYDHNFLRIDGEPPGPDYTITTPFQIKSNRPPNKVFAAIRGNQIVFLKTLTNQDRVTTAVQGFGDRTSDYDVRVDNKKAGVGLRISGNRPLQSESVWSIRAVLAVEPFIHISVGPGQEFMWSMNYDYYAISAQPPELPEGAGKAAFEKTCTTCHDAAQAINARRTRAGWDRVIDDMVTRGANGSDEELEAITNYLTKFFGRVDRNADSRAEVGGAVRTPSREPKAVVRNHEQYGTVASAQTDWPTYGHDPGSTRFSPLRQVNLANVSKLMRAWTFHMTPTAAETATSQPVAGGRGGRRARGSEATPLMVGGVIYMPTPYNRVVALEPETGKLISEFKIDGANASMRGVEYWPGDNSSPPEILFGTTDGKLAALNAKTGKPVPGFGREGFVDMKPGIDNGFANGQFSLSSPPKVYKNVVITGARVQESPSLGFSGDTRGWDVHTGKLLWQFHSVPRPGETGHDTWEGDSWEKRSGTNVWGLISVDEKLGLVYLPYGSPTYDFYGADRKGANLFGDCLVALDALTGKLKWYFQGVHHDTWDYDFEAAPVLMDVTRNGKKIPALAEVSKQGLVYILDRRDGKPIFGMEERPVPKGDVPGEQYWPTEPFPVKPPPLARMSFKPEEIAKVTPEQEKVCRELYQSNGGLHNDGPFTRYGTTGSIVFPGTLGASNWHGASYSPDLGYLFVNIMELADIGKLEKKPEGSALAYSRSGYARFWNSDNFWPCQNPPWGEMAAINVNTGEIAWKVPFGVVEELESKGIHNTGAPNIGGSIATAGGLVFIGATNDHRFRAFDGKTGTVVWETKLESGAYATPITYLGKDGKQYIVVSAGGGSYYDRTSGDSVIAFALP